nr:hypothetical protein [Tanacetum cinerariifolium]
MEFLLPGEVPTASEESSHFQKKRDATAQKIALLLKSSSNCQSKSYNSYAKLVPHVTLCILGIIDVIEFEDSYEAPANAITIGTASDGTGKKKGRTVTLTVDDMQKRKNDVKARTTLPLSLPDEHQLRFSKYKTAQELWAAILKTFGGIEATKKTKKNLLKQQYGNFKAEGSKTLEQMFNRLQVIVSQLQFMDVEIKQDDLNQKFLTSLAPECFMHTIVWRNKSDLDTISLDVTPPNWPDSGFELIGFLDADYAGCNDTFKSTSVKKFKPLFLIHRGPMGFMVAAVSRLDRGGCVDLQESFMGYDEQLLKQMSSLCLDLILGNAFLSLTGMEIERDVSEIVFLDLI